MKINCIDILGVQVHKATHNEILAAIFRTIDKRDKNIIAYANIHSINKAYRLDWLKNFYNQAELVYPDGEGVRLGARILGTSLPQKTALTRWIWDLAEYCQKMDYSLFLLGGQKDSVEKAVARLQTHFTNLNITGYNHGYFDKHSRDSDGVVEQINQCKPQILLVGMGVPIQEKWILNNLEKLKVNIVMTAGSAIDYVAGLKSACPLWISKIGFEWLYRFFQEPSRLFVRYFLGNPLFIYRIFLQKFKKKNKLNKNID